MKAYIVSQEMYENETYWNEYKNCPAIEYSNKKALNKAAAQKCEELGWTEGNALDIRFSKRVNCLGIEYGAYVVKEDGVWYGFYFGKKYAIEGVA